MTAYRVYVTINVHSIDSDDAVNAYATISLLTCLEAILGVFTACLPVLKPVFSVPKHSW